MEIERVYNLWCGLGKSVIAFSKYTCHKTEITDETFQAEGATIINAFNVS
jgi:hypothetical protein